MIPTIHDTTIVPSFAAIQDIAVVPDQTIREVNTTIDIQSLLATEEEEFVCLEDGETLIDLRAIN